MPIKKINALAPVGLSKLKPGRHSDGNGLSLLVTEKGGRSWRYSYQLHGKRTVLGLGGFPAVSLAEAREKALEYQRMRAAGLDPKTERQRSDDTFGDFATRFINQTIAPDLRNKKHLAQWHSTMRTHAAPIWKMPIADIDTAAVLRCLTPIWSTIPETARRVRGRIERVLDAATVQNLRKGENPARWAGHLKATLPNKRPAPVHYKAVNYPQLPALYGRLKQKSGMGARAVRFAILTAARSGEVRGAVWDEFDLEAATWTIPASRMKAGREHSVPLSVEALAILRELEKIRFGDLVFPSARRGKPLSDMTLTKTLRDLSEPCTVHGMRSAFSDWARNETQFPRELVEESLAHTLGAVERAYRRGQALERRAALMAQWAAHCTGAQSENVVTLRA